MVKAAVLGASGGIGQPLSLLLKTCPLVEELALYDVVNTPGVAADLSHISSIAVRYCHNANCPMEEAKNGILLTWAIRKSLVFCPKMMG